MEPKALEGPKESETTRGKGSQSESKKVKDSIKQSEKLLEVPVKKQEGKLLETLGDKQTRKSQGKAAMKRGTGTGANTKLSEINTSPGNPFFPNHAPLLRHILKYPGSLNLKITWRSHR